MAGQVGKLTLKAVIDGFEDVQGLGKALKDISEKAKKTDKAFEITTERIKRFGKATFKTNEGLRGQIAAFEKLRSRTDFQGKAYTNLTKEIRELNKELDKRVTTQRELDRQASKPKALPYSGMKEGLPMRDEKGRKIGDKRRADTPPSLSQLIAAGYLISGKTTLGGYSGFKDSDFKRASGFEGVKSFTLEQHNKTVEHLNQALNGQLDVTKGIRLQSEEYRQVLQHLKTATQQFTETIQAQDAFSERNLATESSRRRTAYQLKDKVAAHKGRMFDRGFGGMGIDPDPEGGGLMRVRSDVQYKTPKLDAYKQLPGPAQFVKWLFETPSWKAMRGEMKGLGAKETGMSFMPQYGQKKDLTYQTDMTYGIPLRGKKPDYSTSFSTQKYDPTGIGIGPSFPPTKTGYLNQISKLAKEEQNLDIGSREHIRTRKELDKVTEEYNKKLEIYENRIKGVVKEQGRSQRLAKKGVVLAGTRDPATGAMIAGTSGKYAGRDSKGRMIGVSSDPFAAAPAPVPMQTVKTLKEFVAEQEKLNVTGRSSINTLTKTRAKFEELRNGLDPTSKRFKQLTDAIAKTDKALNKLNTNKFSGQNLRRTGQSILGAGFVGGPAGFLGAGLGAGIEALRPGGDMAGGAITGGLVASQVLQPIANFGQNSAEYTAMIEKSNIALQAATRIEGDAIASKKAYQVALGTAASVTERFNVPQELAARGMTRLSAAVIGAGGNIHNAGIAFENISAAIKATGGSTEDTKAAVTAMVQIFSKGKVSAEELSGQLGERFPAAVTLFAEANNMTTQELQKGLKDGAIGLDKLWKFVLKLGDKYVDVAEKIGSASVEAGVRSQIAWNKVKLAVGKALQPIGADLQVIGAEILTNLVPVLELAAKVLGAIGRAVSFTAKAVVENFDKIVVVLGTFGSTLIWVNRVALTQFIQTLSVKLGNALSGVIAKMGLAKIATLGFAGSIKAAKAAVVAFTASLMANPIIAVATGLSIAATAAWHFGRRWQRTVKEIESGKMTISDAKIKVAELKKALAGETNEEVAARLETQIAMYEAAIKARKEIIKKANLDEADSFEGKGGGDGTTKWQIIRDHVDELGKQGEHLQGVFVNAFQGMEDAMVSFITTGKLNFKEFARSIIADIARMIAKQMLFNMLSGFINRITNPAASIGMTQGSFMPSNPNFVGVGASVKSSSAQTNILPNLELKAMGDAFASNGIVPYRKGGVVNKPTMFKFGGSRLGVMGEAGPEAILPLKRGRSGKLGVAMQGGNRATTTTVNYTGPTLNFNGDEYVPRSAVGGIINAAANQGASMGETRAMRSLQNSRSARGRIGM